MKEKSETLNFRIPADEKAALLAHCEAEDVKAAQIMRRLIRDFLKQQKGQQCAPQP